MADLQTILVKTKQQLEDAFNIRKTVFVEEQDVPLEIEIDEFENDANHFVLYNNDEPAGAGRLRIFPDYGKVERICILKTMRKSGAGTNLMLAIEKFAKEQGLTTLKLSAQVSAIKFYEKLGYTVTSGEYMDANIPHRDMVKSI